MTGLGKSGAKTSSIQFTGRRISSVNRLHLIWKLAVTVCVCVWSLCVGNIYRSLTGTRTQLHRQSHRQTVEPQISPVYFFPSCLYLLSFNTVFRFSHVVRNFHILFLAVLLPPHIYLYIYI